MYICVALAMVAVEILINPRPPSTARAMHHSMYIITVVLFSKCGGVEEIVLISECGGVGEIVLISECGSLPSTLRKEDRQSLPLPIQQ